MLAEGFLRVLLYREERKSASASKLKRSQTSSRRTDQLNGIVSTSDRQTDSAEAGPNQEELDSIQVPCLKLVPEEGPQGLLIPGYPPGLSLDHDFGLYLDDCSLLAQYPDLQVADSGRISHNPPRAADPQHSFQAPAPGASGYPEWATQQGSQGDPASRPDQGYLVMGPGSNISLDLPGSGLEPMSNSVLNGLLDKQLEEVYMQHLTDNLARCNSDLGNSLLHGLVPPPQPSGSQPDSLEASLEQGPAGDKRISYLSTQNLGPCSSNFSSPVLRISEAHSTHLQHNQASALQKY